jgi:ParB family chromosome partitioning protein
MLTAHRTAAVQAAMASNPEIALAALVHQLVLKVFSSRHVETPVKINIEQAYLKTDAENIEQGRAAVALAEKRQYWQERIEAGKQEGKELFGWLLEQPQQELLELLAFCTAVSINTVSGRENAPSSNVAALMSALNLDMADWWEATGENYLSHVSKDRILGIVAEAVSPQKAQSMNGFKKGDLARHAEQALSGLRWLPDNFKAAKPQDEQES